MRFSIVKYITLAAFFLCNVKFIFAADARAKVVLAADYWCPYNCSEVEDNKGYLVELLSNIFALQGIKLEYKVMPRSEIISKIKSGEVDMTIGYNQETVDKELEVITLPGLYTHATVFAKIGDWRYTGVYSLNNKNICIVLDSQLNDAIHRYFYEKYVIDPKKFIIEGDEYAVNSCMQNLLDDIADVYIEDQIVGEHYIDKYGFGKMIKSFGRVEGEGRLIEIVIRRNQSKDRNYAKILLDGVKFLGSTGDLKLLQKKYKISYK